jgi:hypothetical protein
MKRFLRALYALFMHWVPNLILVAGLVVLIYYNLLLLSLVLIVISKWQVFRGGRASWLRNLRDEACDLVVAVATIALLVVYQGDWWLTGLVAGFYYIWLVILKPRTGPVWMGVQAAVCQLVGLSVLFLFARSLPMPLIVGGAWLVAIIAADHFLSPHHDPARLILTFMWGLLVAQASWLFWRWLILYSLLGSRVIIPQAPLVLTIAGYVFGNMYLDHTQKRLRKVRLLEYVILSIGLFIAIIIGTRWDTRL